MHIDRSVNSKDYLYLQARVFYRKNGQLIHESSSAILVHDNGMWHIAEVERLGDYNAILQNVQYVKINNKKELIITYEIQ